MTQLTQIKRYRKKIIIEERKKTRNRIEGKKRKNRKYKNKNASNQWK